MTQLPSVVIRPPWPDELSRVWKFLGRTLQFKGRIYCRIVVCGEPERIVAGAALQITKEGVGWLHLAFRTRFCEADLVAELLREIDAIAQRENLKEVTTILPESAPWQPLIESSGFVCLRTDEWWLGIRGAKMEARFRVATELVSLPKISRGITIRSLSTDDFPEVSAIAREHGLANLERVGQKNIIGGSIDGYDPDLSPVVLVNGEIAGMMLVKNLGDRAFIHVQAVAKKFSARSSAINAHFFAKFNKPEYRHITRYLFSAQPTVEKITIAMAKRFDAKKVAAFSRFRKTI